MFVAPKRLFSLSALAAVCALAACDDDPTQPVEVFAVTCPTATGQDVNSPIVLSFTTPIDPATVQSGNVVVRLTSTGVEVPGSVSPNSDATQLIFTPSQPLPFDTALTVRVQNVRSALTRTPVAVTVCPLTTEPPPIAELFWNRLPEVGGNDVVGISFVATDLGYVISRNVPLFRWTGGPDWITLAQQPYLSGGYDVSFVSATHGFATFEEARQRRSVIAESFDGGITFDTIGFAPLQSLNRAFFLPIPSADVPFGVVAGGQTFSPAYFAKFNPTTPRTFTVSTFNTTGGVNDLDFQPSDTADGAAATLGQRIGTNVILGTAFRSTNGGTSWSELANAQATPDVLFYSGVAIRKNGDIWVAGGNGFIRRYGAGASGFDATSAIPMAPAGATDPDPNLIPPSPNPTDPRALRFTDVQFAPDDDNYGWVVGAVQVGVLGGVPQYQGLIYATRDGGVTWHRQGVRGADAFGAEFPKLNRLSVLSSTQAWIAGDGGTVLEFSPPGATP